MPLIFLLALAWIALIGGAAYLDYHGKPENVNLLPYHRGTLFVNGYPARDVGPGGRHRVWTGTQLLVHLDTRPISVNAENRAVTLQDGTTVAYGISASVEVKDARKVIYSARDYTLVPPQVLLRSARRILHLSTMEKLMTVGRDAASKAIAQDAEPHLAAAGFALKAFRLSQLFAATPNPPPTTGDAKPPEAEGRPN